MDEVLATVEENHEKKRRNDVTRKQNMAIEERFLIKKRGADTLYYDKNNPEKAIIKEGPDSIKLLDNNPKAIQAIVELAHEKGWTSIKVSGNKKLKMALSAAAHSSGLEVDGFEPPQKQHQEHAGGERENPESPDDTGDTHQDESESTDTRDTEQDAPEAEPDVVMEKPSHEHESDRENSADDVAQQAARKRELAQQQAKDRIEGKIPEELTPRQYAYENLDREEAVELYPEIEPVYEIENNARVYLQQNRGHFSDEAAQVFVDEARNVCFNELEKGASLEARREHTERKRSKESAEGLEL